MSDSIGVLILGGGEATRLPGKLMLAPDDALPLIVHVYRNVRGNGDREVFISGKGQFARETDALLPAPMVVDRWSRRGPLGGMVTTMAHMRSRFVFAVAGDAPFVDAAFVAELNATRLALAGHESGVVNVEAVVPVHERAGETQFEPLAAIYDRLAFLREGLPVLRSGRGALRAVIDRLRTHFVPVRDERVFTNVNTETDYAALRARLAGEHS